MICILSIDHKELEKLMYQWLVIAQPSILYVKNTFVSLLLDGDYEDSRHILLKYECHYMGGDKSTAEVKIFLDAFQEITYKASGTISDAYQELLKHGQKRISGIKSTRLPFVDGYSDEQELLNLISKHITIIDSEEYEIYKSFWRIKYVEYEKEEEEMLYRHFEQEGESCGFTPDEELCACLENPCICSDPDKGIFSN